MNLLLAIVITGGVFSVHDGDTLTLTNGTGRHKVRLAGIDAPELAQPFGTESRDYLRSLAPIGSQATADVTDTDRYGRSVAIVRAGSLELNTAMVTNGLAWRYPAFDKVNTFTGAEHSARASARGLWSGTNVVAPWLWRKARK